MIAPGTGSLSYEANSTEYHRRRLWVALCGGFGLALIAALDHHPSLWLLVAIAAVGAVHAIGRLRRPGDSAFDSIVVDSLMIFVVLAVLRPPSAVIPVVLIYLLVPAGIFLSARAASWAIGVSVVGFSALRWLAPAVDARGAGDVAVVGVLAVAVLPSVVWLVGAFSHAMSGRRSIERDLEVAAGRFEALFHRSVVPMFRTRFDGVLVDANLALVELLRAPDRSTLEGISVLALYVHPARRIRMINRLEQYGLVKGLEVELRRFDGSTLAARLTASLVEHDDQILIEGILEDVTDEKLAEEREMISAQVFDQLGSAVVISDADRRISFWNRRAEEMFGFGQADVVGKFTQDVLKSPHIGAADEVRMQLDSTGFWQGETEVLASEGIVVRCAVSLSRVVTPDGTPAGFAMVFTDLGELHAARRRVKFQAALLEHVHNAVIATDPDGRVTYWNPAAETLYGWAESEAVGSLVTDLTVPVTGRVAASEVMARLTDTGRWQGEFEVTRRDGSTFPALVTNAVLTDEHGETAGVVGVSTDLTDLRRAQDLARESGELARSVLESLHAPVAVVDYQGEIIQVNGAWTRFAVLNGGDPTSTGVGVNYLEVCDRAADLDPEIALVAIGLRDVLQKRAGSYSHEYPCHSPTEERYFRMEVAPIPNVGAVVSHIDVTADELARRALEDVVAQKDSFLATVSHELRTPLTAVVGFAEYLRSGDHDPEDLPVFHDLVANQAREVADLVEDLLMAGRLDSATVVIRPELLSGREMVDRVIIPWARSTEIEVAGSDSLGGGLVYADPLRLRQILRNLISNAMRHGEPPISVEISSGDGTTTFAVSDTGGGVPEDVLDSLFEPYSRAAHSGGQPGSMGLGLFVSKRLAELMGGTIEYHHEVGRVTFTVSLPTSP